jgi:hypothetical protein
MGVCTGAVHVITLVDTRVACTMIEWKRQARCGVAKKPLPVTVTS